MITVKEVLCLPVLQKAVVRAGKNGLGRNIQWAHVIDHNDVGYFLEGGELLLTCGQIWPTEQEEQTRILNLFLTHQISGIVFAVGRYLNKCPEVVLEFGRKYAIPIIEIPFKVPFVKVTRGIHQEIMKRQYKKVELAAHIPLKLTDKLKEAANFIEVCEILGGNLKCPVFLTDSYNKIIARSFPSGESINISKLTQELMSALDGHVPPYQSYLIDEIDGDAQAVRISVESLRTYLGVPIQNENEYFGTLWIINSSEQGREERVRALKHANTILKELIEHKNDMEAKRRQLQAELLELLLEKPKIAPIIVEEKLNQLDLVENRNWMAGSLTYVNSDTLSFSQDVQILYELCKHWIEATPEIDGFCEQFEGSLVIILTFNKDQIRLEDHLKNLQTLLNEKLSAILLFGGIKKELFSLQESYQEAVSLASIISHNQPGENLYLADHYCREIMLYSTMDAIRAQELRDHILPKELMSEGEVLYETLRCLMLNQYNRERTAKLLHIHRNTLRYRIEKIEHLLGKSLNSLRCQFWIQIAFDLEPLVITK